jgi:hypothetical protein
MSKPAIFKWAANAAVLSALAGCAGIAVSRDRVQLEVGGPVIDPPLIPLPDFYRLPRVTGGGGDDGRFAQRWAMLGREDQAAASESGGAEYSPRECEAAPGSPSGWDAVIDAIVARAADHHRETTRRLLAKLRPLGFSVLAAETFSQGYGSTSPLEAEPAVAWPRMVEGFYSSEPTFGRLVREAKAQGYRLVPYEEIYDPAVPASDDLVENVVRRETAQAWHLAEIVRQMRPTSA